MLQAQLKFLVVCLLFWEKKPKSLPFTETGLSGREAPPPGCVFCPLSLLDCRVLFPPGWTGSGCSSPSPLGYGGVVALFFLIFLSVLAGRLFLRSLRWGEAGFSVVDSVFWPDLHSFSSNFWSQIYVRSLTFVRHVPPSRVPCRLPPLMPEASVVSVSGARRVVLTRQGAFALWLRV
jgi:hypothetical protein